MRSRPRGADLDLTGELGEGDLGRADLMPPEPPQYGPDGRIPLQEGRERATVQGPHRPLRPGALRAGAVFGGDEGRPQAP